MTILNSCCCWNSLRTGCFASAAYSLVYYIATLSFLVRFMQDDYSDVDDDSPPGMIIDMEHKPRATLTLNGVHFASGCLGILTAPMLFIAIYKDKRYFIIPWVINACSEILIHVFSVSRSFYQHKTVFNPFTTSLVTFDIFGILIFVYAILCAISQYQEYLAGRGTSIGSSNDSSNQFVAVRYIPGVPQTPSRRPRNRRRSTIPRPGQSEHVPEDFLLTLEPPPKPVGLFFVTNRAQFLEVQQHCCVHGTMELVRPPSPELTEQPSPELTQQPSPEHLGPDSLWTDVNPVEVPVPIHRRRSSEHYYRPMARARAAHRKMSMAAKLYPDDNRETTV